MKLSGWAVIVVGMVFFLTIIGIDTGLTNVLEYFGIIASNGTVVVTPDASSLFDYLFDSAGGILVALTATAGLLVGLYWKTGDTNILLIPYIISITSLMLSVFYPTIKLVSGTPWAVLILSVILGTISIGLITSSVDYFLGR